MNPNRQSASLGESVLRWWKEESDRAGHLKTTAEFFSKIFEFLRDSTPARRRSRYGDVDFDWERRVDTTGATISDRDRFLGLFHSPYQPTEPTLFHEMMETLTQELKLDLSKFVFIDIGSGKGRALLLAADHPFKRIIGVELLPTLHRIAQENITKYQSETQKCFVIESICADARDFQFPPEPVLLYLFNPLPEAGLRQLLANLERSLSETPRAVYVLYHNPLLKRVIAEFAFLRKAGRTHQYAIYAALRL